VGLPDNFQLSYRVLTQEEGDVQFLEVDLSSRVPLFLVPPSGRHPLFYESSPRICISLRP